MGLSCWYGGFIAGGFELYIVSPGRSKTLMALALEVISIGWAIGTL